MAYSKSKTAEQLGISKQELENRAKSEGYKSTEAYVSAYGGVAGLITKSFRDAITKDIVEIDRQLDELFQIGLTQEEKDLFLQKAIETITPYYDEQTRRIQEGIREGEIRTAEDALQVIREVEQETSNKLAYYDLQTAETEEDFINRLADITATKEEDIQMKTMDWRDRIESVKLNQVQSGNFMAGWNVQERKDLEQRKQLELSQIERKAQVEQLGLETQKKYNLDAIRLARESAQQARQRQIGAPVETEETKQSALSTLGYNDMGQLPGATQIQQRREASGISPVYDKYALQNLEGNRLRDVEATKLELEEQRLAENKTAYEAQKQKLLADKAAKAAQLGSYRI